ncbi:hypothetical protein RvY_12217 [Ramazzottius varieornatus]|uniref:Uncharacterized protein n=1 Tax=Ramazzottius varieornatus TaxID=947166 RepID=A0A1D1VP64_RAMVA|nr:hypothetical protein RvY_12217 [Ramazzottius varieornatus]
MFKPLVLFDGVLHLGSMYDNTKDKLYVAVNRSGVMDHKVLTDYFRQEVLPNAPHKEPSACPLSNADVGTLVPAPPNKRIGSKKVQ